MAKTDKKILYDFMQKLALKSNQPKLVPIEEINEGLFKHVDDIVFDEYYMKWLISSADERITLEKESESKLWLLYINKVW